MMQFFKKVLLTGLAVMLPLAPALAGEQAQEWELVNPQGEIERVYVDPAARIDTLDGKTVVLRWNGKHNGDVFLDRLAGMMAERLPNTTVIKAYVEDPNMNRSSATMAFSTEFTNSILAMEPDLVIASQAD